jgi:hypothetical protein
VRPLCEPGYEPHPTPVLFWGTRGLGTPIVTKWLQNLMFWRRPDEPQAPRKVSAPQPDDPFAIETPEQTEYREERQRKLLEEQERRFAEGRPPEDDFNP